MKILLFILMWFMISCANYGPENPCAYDDPTEENENPAYSPPTIEQAVSVWPQELLTDRCIEEQELMRVILAPKEEADAMCALSEWGCYLPGSYEVVAAVGKDVSYATEHIVAHELSHWLFNCSGIGGTEADHGKEEFNDTIQSILTVWEMDREKSLQNDCPY